MGWLVAFFIAIAAAIVIIYQGIMLSDANRNANRNVQQTRPAQNAVNNNRPSVPAINNRTETGSMIYFANDRHGLADKEYRFNYKKVGGTWKAYILRTPNIRGRNNTIPHTLHDSGGSYICWSGTVNSLKDIQNISRAWADKAQNYMATGSW